MHIQRELNCNKLPVQQFSQKEHIFGKGDNSLLLGINYLNPRLSLIVPLKNKKLDEFDLKGL